MSNKPGIQLDTEIISERDMAILDSLEAAAFSRKNEAPNPSPVPSGAPAFPSPSPARDSRAPVMNHLVPVSLSLWDSQRFCVSRGYPTQMHQFLKEFNGSVFDDASKCFHFPLKSYAQFLKVVRNMKYGIINEIPKNSLDAVEDSNRRTPDEFQLDRLPAALWTSLFAFQRTGVEFIVKRGGRGLIADEMGLGKTIQAIALACYYRGDWPVLVVCPSSLRITWGQQFEKWLPDQALDLNIVLTSVKSNVNHDINIVSFDLASRMADVLKKKQFQVVIVDESHYLKNNRSKRSQVILPVAQKAKRCVFLSGTPALSRPVELFSQLNALAPKWFPTFTAFGTRYCDAKPRPWGMDYLGSSNARELNTVLSTLMIRRCKSEVLDQLPAKIRQKVLIHVEAKHMKTLQDQMADFKNAGSALHQSETKREAGEASAAQKGVFFQVFRNTGRAKIPSIVEYVLERLGEEEVGPKFLVFAHHADVMDGIAMGLKGKANFIRIDGSTPSTQRQGLADVFQTDPSCRVALLSITAAGVGLTLTAASFVFFAELFYNPGALLQAEDRAHRIGQQSRVWVHYLVAKGTVDEHMFKLLNRKIGILGETLDGVSGRQLEIQGETNRDFATEKLRSISDGSFVAGILKMIHAGETMSPADEVYEEEEEGEYGSDESKESSKKRAREEEEEALAQVDANMEAEDIVQKAREKSASASSKLQQFLFKKPSPAVEVKPEMKVEPETRQNDPPTPTTKLENFFFRRKT